MTATTELLDLTIRNGLLSTDRDPCKRPRPIAQRTIAGVAPKRLSTYLGQRPRSESIA